MRSVVNLIKQLKRDEDGAALIEYTVLLAILLVAVIAVIAGVGAWISNQWTTSAPRFRDLGTAAVVSLKPQRSRDSCYGNCFAGVSLQP